MGSNTDLWKQFSETKDEELRDELICRYLFLVKVVVGKMVTQLPSFIKMDDLYSSGVTGLIKAIEKFDFTKNTKFETYAVFLVKGAIIDELRRLDWIPRSVHQKANLITNAESSLQQKLGRDPTEEELSDYLNISNEDLNDLLVRIRPVIMIPLNAEVTNSEEEVAPLLERIADAKAELSSEILDRKEFSRILQKAIEGLSDQERKVLILYYYEELMLKEIGQVLGISESRVSQIHTKALLKLRGRLKTSFI